MPFGYTDIDWAALTKMQRHDAVFAQLDGNLVFAGDSTKAAKFAEAATYLLAHRPMQEGSNNHSLTYASLESLLKDANKIVADHVAGRNQSTFTQARMLT